MFNPLLILSTLFPFFLETMDFIDTLETHFVHCFYTVQNFLRQFLSQANSLSKSQNQRQMENYTYACYINQVYSMHLNLLMVVYALKVFRSKRLKMQISPHFMYVSLTTTLLRNFFDTDEFGIQ